MAVLALAMPLLRRLERVPEAVMFHRRHGARNVLLRLARELPGLMNIDRIATALTRDLVADIPVLHASFYVRESASPVEFGCFQSSTAPPGHLAPPPALSRRLTEWLTRRKSMYVVERAARGERAPRAGFTVAAELQAAGVAIVLPLHEDGEVRAALTIGEKRSGAAFDGDELTLLEAVAANASIALKNARLYDDLRRQMAELHRTHQQLLQSGKLAAIGELAASVAHEVNNPLLAIIGHAGMLAREISPGPAAARRLEAIQAQAHRAGKILKDLLDFSRRREPHHETLDILDVLRRSIELVAPRLSRGGIVATTEAIGPVPPVVGDRDELTQVFVNLLTNAIDAMPDGGTVTLRTEVRAVESILCLAVTVADTGLGMTAEQLTHIFEPFYTTKAEGAGTGLGLSISRGIILRHEGTLEAASEPGKGSSFVVSLPIAPLVPVAASVGALSANASAGDARSSPSRRCELTEPAR